MSPVKLTETTDASCQQPVAGATWCPRGNEAVAGATLNQAGNQAVAALDRHFEQFLARVGFQAAFHGVNT
jgi:hypothetical protein